MWKCTQSPPGGREEQAGWKEREGRAGAQWGDSQSPASQDHYTTMCTRGGRRPEGAAGSHPQLGEGGKDDTNAPQSRGHNQHARGAQPSPWSGWGGRWAHDPLRAHSSNFPSRMCSKEKGRNLKPVPL